ncbi:auxin-induced protein 10A5-like [Lycium barbarum]|uniref:auxin-induced protein 10A5-like n=1 Tax=Lycium barbarum TaxID=112863 RepID=UPI00293F275C|nr:auxin-induced protein 10A5-like [Lycium barbarum]
MSSKIGKSSKIRCIVRISQMLRQWKKRSLISSSKRIAPDVPAGHVAISVGSSCRRFVVRATYLNHPIFRKLLIQAEEEYGFSNHGTLAIPCDELLFEEILRFVSRSGSGRSINIEDFQKSCHARYRNSVENFGDSRPLLGGSTKKSVC